MKPLKTGVVVGESLLFPPVICGGLIEARSKATQACPSPLVPPRDLRGPH